MVSSTTDRERFVTQALTTHSSALRSFVAARVPTTEVDDVLQNAALRAIEAACALDDEARVRGWLFTIHRNLITDTLRQLGRSERLAEALRSEAPPPLDDTLSQCDCSLVQASKLAPAYATILQLVDAQGTSISDAARTLGLTPNNTRVRLHRARKALRDAMQAHCGVQAADECQTCRCVEEDCCAP